MNFSAEETCKLEIQKLTNREMQEHTSMKIADIIAVNAVSAEDNGSGATELSFIVVENNSCICFRKYFDFPPLLSPLHKI